MRAGSAAVAGSRRRIAFGSLPAFLSRAKPQHAQVGQAERGNVVLQHDLLDVQEDMLDAADGRWEEWGRRAM